MSTTTSATVNNYSPLHPSDLCSAEVRRRSQTRARVYSYNQRIAQLIVLDLTCVLQRSDDDHRREHESTATASEARNSLS
ncbi:hypothetical protein J6590_066566 [Homalodisca vitripennis]|nr:hypothetical protein J6590_066566 [Homalodisca vitripennis]